MKRIIIHWTAGGYVPNATDLKHYHYLIDGDGKIVDGQFPVSANTAPLETGRYAAHTRACNTDSIGVALCAMRGAQERPFDPGTAPIKQNQIDTLAKHVANLCTVYDIPVSPTTVLTHAEVQGNLGIRQNGKWDILWLPGMSAPATNPNVIGEILRDKVKEALRPKPVRPVKEAVEEVLPVPAALPATNQFPAWLQAIINAVKGLFA